ncbi:PilZ domain-containing protein [Candidatus Latescibacterota bacterium]
MSNKRNNERMKLFSFINSEVFVDLTKEGCFNGIALNLHDRPEFTIYNTVTGECVGNLVDISKSGIMIVSESPVTENTIYHLRMEFLRDIYFDARCAWARDIGCGNYITGLEFSKIEPEDIDSIEDAINQFLTGE